MYNYGKYGKENPFTYRLSEEELKKVKPGELIKIIKELFSYNQRILYYGPENEGEIISTLDEFHKIPSEINY